MSQTEAQKKATKKYREKNPEKTHDVAMRSVKSAIKNHATAEDLKKISRWIDQKKNGLEVD